MVGINDRRYFSKCFEAQVGMTPTEYREKSVVEIGAFCSFISLEVSLNNSVQPVFFLQKALIEGDSG